MNIVVLTNKGSLFGKRLLNDLISSGIEIKGSVLISQPPGFYWRLYKNVSRRIGVFDALRFSLKRISTGASGRHPLHWHGRRFITDYNEMGMPVLHSRGTNSSQTVEKLRTLDVDILILGQAGIVRNDVLKIPRAGTLNAHTGILPYYRGVDCPKWAIYNGDFYRIGCSVHWVDGGVDTGDIITKQIYEFSGDETVDVLCDRLQSMCASLLTKVVSSAVDGNIPHGEPQKKDEGEQYCKMPARTEKSVEVKLSEFLANRKPRQETFICEG